MLGLVAALSALATLGGASLAIAGLLGIAVPVLDLFNHFQLLLLPGTILAAILCLITVHGRWRALVLTVAATGLVASSILVVPEMVSSIAPRAATDPSARTYRLMTFNVYANNGAPEKILDPIIETDPDILLVQEFRSWIAEMWMGPLTEHYPYSIRCLGGRRANNAIFSRFPITKIDHDLCTERAARAERTSIILARIDLPGGEPLTLATTHMDWPVPIARQRNQYDRLVAALEGIEGPVILGGDMNTTPFAFTMRRFEAQSGLVRQTRFLPTFPAPPTVTEPLDLPLFLPLDHIFTRGVQVHDLARARVPGGSDHYPVVMDFSVSP